MAGRLDDGGDDLAENHEINVTPFIDVMLVLLIIFMVAAPLSTVDVPVGDSVQIGEAEFRIAGVVAEEPGQLGGVFGLAPRIFLRADKTVPYGELMIVMNLLRAAGYLKVALVGLEEAPPPLANPALQGQQSPAAPGTGAAAGP
mgnify:CR=1 FL=1